MKWDKVKDFAAVGKVYGAHAFRAPPLINAGKGWCLGFDVAPDVPTGGSPDLYTKRGDLRVFRTLDAVAEAVQALGLGSLRVELGGAYWK